MSGLKKTNNKKDYMQKKPSNHSNSTNCKWNLK